MHNKDKKVNKKVLIEKQVEEILQQASSIEEVSVSPFLKDKIMHQLSKEKEAVATAIPWFTPKLQLATLVCVIVLNVFVLSTFSSENYDDNVSDFAASYELSTDNNTSYFNQ